MVVKERNHATSGSDICEGPSEASEMPACEPTIFRFAPEFIAISIWSYARLTNFANVEQNGIFPPADILSRLHIFVGLDEATEKYFNEQFATVTGLG